MGKIAHKLKKYDKPLIGVIFGLILPIFGFILSFYIKTRGTDVDFEKYVALTLNSSLDQQDILIFCMMPNMFLFYFTNFKWNLYELTKGLVAVTLLLGLSLFLLTW